MNLIVEAMTALKGADISDSGTPIKNVRYAYIEFGVDGVVIFDPTLSDDFNTAPVSDNDLLEQYYALTNMECGDEELGLAEEPDLCAALEAAFQEFEDNGSDSLDREKKILIISNNMDTSW